MITSSINTDPIIYHKNEHKTKLLVPTLKAYDNGFLGEGCFGEVFIHRENQSLAVKKSWHDLSKEYEVACYLDHRCLVAVKQLFIKRYPGNRKLSKLVMERIIGERMDSERFSDKKLSEENIERLCDDVKDTMQYLFNCKVSWNDMKVENLFLTEDGHLKICDYGMWIREENVSVRMEMLFMGAIDLLGSILRSSVSQRRCFNQLPDILLPDEFLDQILMPEGEDQSAQEDSSVIRKSKDIKLLTEAVAKKLLEKSEDQQLKLIGNYVDYVKAKCFELFQVRENL